MVALTPVRIDLKAVTILGQATEFTFPEPSRADIDAMQGALVLEFGTDWCGFCRAAQPLIAAAFQGHPGIGHIRVEDGSGRRLGRSFRIKLWPTLVFLRDGREVSRLVRPQQQDDISAAMARILQPA